MHLSVCIFYDLFRSSVWYSGIVKYMLYSRFAVPISYFPVKFVWSFYTVVFPQAAVPAWECWSMAYPVTAELCVSALYGTVTPWWSTSRPGSDSSSDMFQCSVFSSLSDTLALVSLSIYLVCCYVQCNKVWSGTMVVCPVTSLVPIAPRLLYSL